MKYFVCVAGVFLLAIIISGIVALFRYPKEGSRQVCYPKFFAILGIVSSVLFYIPTVITAFLDEPVLLPLGFFAFSLLGVAFIVAFTNCRISYDGDGFVKRNFLGIKRRYTYGQITAIREDMREEILYFGKRKIVVDAFLVGGAEFIGFTKKRYRTVHNGKAIPKVKRSGRDIFKGNVYDPEGFVFAYVIVSVFIVIFAVFIVWYIYFAPDALDTDEMQVTFETFDISDNDIVLKGTDGSVYKISFADELLDTGAIEAVCDGESVVTVHAREITPDDEEAYYSVSAILSDGTYILSFEETRRLHRQEYFPLIFFPIVFGIVWGIYIVGSIIVGRDPKRFGKKAVKLFFKDGYVKY